MHVESLEILTDRNFNHFKPPPQVHVYAYSV
jgi:hypothetical protein